MDSSSSDPVSPSSEASEAGSPPPRPKPVVRRRRFRLYVTLDCIYCSYLRDILHMYPAVLGLLDIFIITEDRQAEHKIRGVPSILDLHLDRTRSWLGSQCFDWIRQSVLLSAEMVPKVMPTQRQLLQRYASSSPPSTEPRTETDSPSPEIDTNQEELPPAEIDAVQ